MKTTDKSRGASKYLLVFTLVALLLTPLAVSATPVSHGPRVQENKALVLNQQMRKLWEDHVTWTRVVIISFAAGLPDLDSAVNRLLQNQADIGNAIKPYYGAAAGDQVTALLREHIVLAADLLSAAKAADAAKVATVQAQWYANADDIAAFLHNANPKKWPLEEMQHMMHSHLDLTLQEATARLGGDWQGDINAYDAVHEEILQMADMLSWGIVKQFPQQFR